MEGEIRVTVTVRGLREPNLAAQTVVNHVKRSLFMVNGDAEGFGAEIEYAAPGMCEPELLVLDGGDWRRERDLNSRGG